MKFLESLKNMFTKNIPVKLLVLVVATLVVILFNAI